MTSSELNGGNKKVNNGDKEEENEPKYVLSNFFSRPSFCLIAGFYLVKINVDCYHHCYLFNKSYYQCKLMMVFLSFFKFCI